MIFQMLPVLLLIAGVSLTYSSVTTVDPPNSQLPKYDPRTTGKGGLKECLSVYFCAIEKDTKKAMARTNVYNVKGCEAMRDILVYKL